MGRALTVWGGSRAGATAALLLFAMQAAAGEGCEVWIEANDQMQFSARELKVPETCAKVQVTLRHTGSLTAQAMGHDWVLSKSTDVAPIANAGLAAGFEHNFQAPGDKRILAATPLIGGGESTTISFSTSVLERGGRYTFFCSAPGHWSSMKGRFVFG
jgi:azurin